MNTLKTLTAAIALAATIGTAHAQACYTLTNGKVVCESPPKPRIIPPTHLVEIEIQPCED
jgi:hypothetical protein